MQIETILHEFQTALSPRYIVGCLGVVQLGGLDPWFNQGGPAKVGASEPLISRFKQQTSMHTKGGFCLVWGRNEREKLRCYAR